MTKKFTISLICSIFIFITSLNYSQAYDFYEFKYADHTYRLFFNSATWEEAAKIAADSCGYLVEINSKEEQNAIYSILTNGHSGLSKEYTSVPDGGGVAYLWIGATDKSEEGSWIWDGDNDGQGQVFWTGQGAAGQADGKPVDALYNNWGGTSKGSVNEPDDYADNQDAAAMALAPWPKNSGAYGDQAEWNDIDKTNRLMFLVEYAYSTTPDKASTPQGNLNVCPGTESTYTTEVLDSTTVYNWNLEPQHIGTLEANSNTLTISWAPNYQHEDAYLSVSGSNIIGMGETSDKLTISVSGVPNIPESITGETQACKDIEIEYSVQTVNNAHYYEWQADPPESATITPSYGNTALVKWNKNYMETKAKLLVASVNNCGKSKTKAHTIQLLEPPFPPYIHPSSHHDHEIKQGSVVTFVSQLQENIDSLSWFLSPEHAGYIKKEYIDNAGNTAIDVDFHDDFLGAVDISAKAHSKCGTSSLSDQISIILVTKLSNIQALQTAQTFNISPNPSYGLINISSPITATDCQISVIDEKGSLVYIRSGLDIQQQSNYTLHLNSLSPGSYILNIRTKNTRYSAKFLVVK